HFPTFLFHGLIHNSTQSSSIRSFSISAIFAFDFHDQNLPKLHLLLLRSLPNFNLMGRSKSDPSRKIQRRLIILRRCILRVWNQILMCSKPIKYRMLSHPAAVAGDGGGDEIPLPRPAVLRSESDLVALKISLLGDSQIGKTSFLAKYVGDGGDELEEGGRSGGGDGLNLMDKVLEIGGARISYSLWEFDGGEQSREQIPVACKDSVAILIMFDLTSRVTLNGVMRWYQEARKWNQARAYAKALNAPLFFSSATYNINVNKIFKFITAKLFDLPWTLERNLTIGEPIIDF
ncbi:Septum-promoting GTP-binding protein 1, partial [Linum perenne]